MQKVLKNVQKNEIKRRRKRKKEQSWNNFNCDNCGRKLKKTFTLNPKKDFSKSPKNNTKRQGEWEKRDEKWEKKKPGMKFEKERGKNYFKKMATNVENTEKCHIGIK